MKKNMWSIVAASVVGAACMISGAAQGASLYDYNLVTISDAQLNNVHLHGISGVGGTLTNNGVDEYGADVAGNGVKLQVVNNVTGPSGAQMHFPGSGGSLNYGGTLSSNVSLVGGSGSHTSVNLSAFTTEIGTDSTTFSGLTANSTFSNGAFNITPHAVAGLGNVAVFSIPASSLFVQNQNFSYTLNGTPDAIIVNVTGTSITGTQANFNGSWSSIDSKLIFNFYQATSLSLAATSWYGSILAPSATLTKSSNDIYGGVYVNSLNMSSGEIHADLYTGSVPSPNTTPNIPVPLPGAAVMVLSMAPVGLAGLWRRKRA
jgi:choice-of-anchor A domain-containing protein